MYGITLVMEHYSAANRNFEKGQDPEYFWVKFDSHFMKITLSISTCALPFYEKLL